MASPSTESDVNVAQQDDTKAIASPAQVDEASDGTIPAVTNDNKVSDVVEGANTTDDALEASIVSVDQTTSLDIITTEDGVTPVAAVLDDASTGDDQDTASLGHDTQAPIDQASAFVATDDSVPVASADNADGDHDAVIAESGSNCLPSFADAFTQTIDDDLHIIRAEEVGPVGCEQSQCESEDSSPADTSGCVIKPVLTKYSVTVFHERARTYIQLFEDGKTNYIRVNSQLVSGVSLAWANKMDNFVFMSLPGRKTFREVVMMDSNDDDPMGIRLIMQLIHFKYLELPDRLSIAELYSVARVAYKHSCTTLLAPFAERWILNGLQWEVKSDTTGANHDKVFVLAWLLGEARAFAKVFTEVVDTMTINPLTKIPLDRDGNSWLEQPLSSRLISVMRAARLNRLQDMMNALDRPVTQLLEAPTSYTFCRANDADEFKVACQAQQLGSLMSGLVAAQFMPFPAVEDYYDSVNSMAARIADIKVNRFKIPGVLPHNDAHVKCGVKHKEAIKAIKEQPIKLQRTLAAELRFNGMKSGAFRDENFVELAVMTRAEDKRRVQTFPALETDKYIHTFSEIVEFEPVVEDGELEKVQDADADAVQEDVPKDVDNVVCEESIDDAVQDE